MAQTDQFTERTGPRQVQPVRLAQQTLRYKTFLKTTMVEALQNAFALYEDKALKKTKIDIAYPTDRADFPAVVVKWYEEVLKNAGVGHREYGPHVEEIDLDGEVQITQGSGNISGLPTVEDIFPGFTEVKGLDIPQGSLVIEILSSGEILIDKPCTATRKTKITLAEAVDLGTKFTEYHHSIYHGNIALEVYGLSTVDRDKVTDALVEIIQMGTVGEVGLTFQERIYNTIGLTPYSRWHFIAVNTDLFSGFGEREEMPPWGPEDQLLYRSEYRVPIMGEFYSITPKQGVGELSLVREVDVYPWSKQDETTPAPNEFDKGIVPQDRYIKIRKHTPFTPFHTLQLNAALGFAKVPNKIKVFNKEGDAKPREEVPW